MSEEIHLKMSFSKPARHLYEAWLDSDAHSGFTGSPAVIDPGVGGKFTAWDQYIWGQNLELDSGKRILQSWRTTEFPEDAPDSLLEVLFEENGENTLLTLNHTQIPDGQAGQYTEGWQEYYFTPMAEYFSR